MSVEDRDKLPNNPEVGTMLSRVDITTLYDIVDIYGQIVGGRGWQLFRGYDPSQVMENLSELKTRGNFIGWRLGSNFPEDIDESGKLGVWREQNIADDVIIRFDYDPNVLGGMPAPEERREEFKAAVAEYLKSHKLAVDLPKR